MCNDKKFKVVKFAHDKKFKVVKFALELVLLYFICNFSINNCCFQQKFTNFS